MEIFAEVTSAKIFARVTSDLKVERVEFTLAIQSILQVKDKMNQKVKKLENVSIKHKRE